MCLITSLSHLDAGWRLTAYTQGHCWLTSNISSLRRLKIRLWRAVLSDFRQIMFRSWVWMSVEDSLFPSPYIPPRPQVRFRPWSHCKNFKLSSISTKQLPRLHDAMQYFTHKRQMELLNRSDCASMHAFERIWCPSTLVASYITNVY